MTMATESAFCVKCKAKQAVQNPQVTTLSNGKPALKGQCAVCGTTVMRLLPREK